MLPHKVEYTKGYRVFLNRNYSTRKHKQEKIKCNKIIINEEEKLPPHFDDVSNVDILLKNLEWPGGQKGWNTNTQKFSSRDFTFSSQCGCRAF
jgi:hypothetical protein